MFEGLLTEGEMDVVKFDVFDDSELRRTVLEIMKLRGDLLTNYICFTECFLPEGMLM
jgi:hypothetical protein